MQAAKDVADMGEEEREWLEVMFDASSSLDKTRLAQLLEDVCRISLFLVKLYRNGS